MDLQEFFEVVQNLAIIPLLLSIAFIFFLWNIFRYFILGISKEGDKKQGKDSGRTKAKRSAMWGIFAFVIILIWWGLVNLFVDATGLGDVDEAIMPDYMIQRENERGSDPSDIPF